MSHLIYKLRKYGLATFLKYALFEIYQFLWVQGVTGSYSQRGEDKVVDALLGDKKRGFYVDIGANHPARFNNTMRFYQKGWWGINIEPDTACFEDLQIRRPRDINLNLGVGAKNANVTFYKFIPDTISTFSQVNAQKMIKVGYTLVYQKKIEVKKLGDILDKYAHDKKIDFLSTDTEGQDLAILKSNNWQKYRPKVICTESAKAGVVDTKKNKSLERFLLSKGYQKFLDNGLNTIYLYK